MTAERDIKKYLMKKVKERGGEMRKIKWEGHRNAPDWIVLLPGWHVLVELKRPGKKATKAQEREHNLLWDSGIEVFVCSTFEEVDMMIPNWIPVEN